jgi:hypothetical protein
VLRLASRRAAAASRLCGAGQRSGVVVVINAGTGRRILQPGWRATTTPAPAARQALQSKNCLFNLLSLKPQFSEHFVDVQNDSLLRTPTACMGGRVRPCGTRVSQSDTTIHRKFKATLEVNSTERTYF